MAAAGGRRGPRDRAAGTPRRTGRRHLRHRRVLPRQPRRVRARRRRERRRLHLRRRAYGTGSRSRPSRRGRGRCGARPAAGWPAAGSAASCSDPVLLRHLLWIAVASGLPLQLHAGLGEPGLRIDRTDPVLLTDFVRGHGRLGTDLVLLHGYPYHRHAAHLAGVFPHVYADSGAALVRTGARAATVLAEILELAPFGKIALLQRRPRAARTARGGRPAVPRGARPGAGRLGRRGRVVAGGRAAGGRDDRGGQRAPGVRAGVGRDRHLGP